MKKIIGLSMIVCMFLSGCKAGLSVPGISMDLRSTDGIFNCSNTYFDHYTSKKEDHVYRVKGIIHQMASDRNGVLTEITAQDNYGNITITGSLNCTKGTIRLVYTMPDGTETLIADGLAGKIDTQIDVMEGEGTVNFVSDGKDAVCKFDLTIEAEDSVSFGSKENAVESTEELEDLDRIENTETVEAEDLKGLGIDEIQDNWPEKICYDGDGVYANPLSVKVEIDGPMSLSLSCVTIEGDLRLKITDCYGKTVYFSETNPNGTYTVDLQDKGIYQILFYAKYHVGSVVVTPVEESY